jgi:hypothetical protein
VFVKAITPNQCIDPAARTGEPDFNVAPCVAPPTELSGPFSELTPHLAAGIEAFSFCDLGDLDHTGRHREPIRFICFRRMNACHRIAGDDSSHSGVVFLVIPADESKHPSITA